MLIISILGAVGSTFSNFAFSIEKAAIIAPITGSSSLVSVIFSKFYLKEKLNLQKLLAAVIIVAGIVGISIN